MKNQVVGRVSLRSVPRLGGSLLLASTVAIAVGCSGENNPTSPTVGPGVSLVLKTPQVSQSFLAAEAVRLSRRRKRWCATGPKEPTSSSRRSVADSALQTHMAHGDLNFSPISLDRATFSSSLNAAEALLAFDGNLTTSWSAKSHPVQYIEIDFGSPQSFWKIAALVDQYPSGATSHHVMLDGNAPAFSWTGVTSYGDQLTHKFDTVQTAQRVRITTTQSPSWVAWREIQFPTCG